ncbi:DNA repair exonuclease [Sistotremastrum niveocremeum HHB9708]|uniref:Double-strand break repair protein n=1 Tax=Sistotremastrum niveocremeum HHB9708 TaxID=1314777 RepID=A0A164N6J7_9AGAM|nr:DNA repair exonuclease [Sistotremastrum niveocremeum HHB9708]
MSQSQGPDRSSYTHRLPEVDPEDTVNTIKIMLATDNHIGYLERDPVRGQDAINTFREILQLAVKHDVDFVLLAGDLFHENRPSRDCIYRTSALLREYCLGDKPVQIELLSDPDEGKADGFSFPAINYEDPNFNVGIPVFSIHGNHDDPQGAGPEGALCALDLISVTGLLNYMGKIDLPSSDAEAQNTGIAIKPVLLRKGTTRLGLYGVGNVKDQRMHFELRSNRVRMFMPRDKDDWFNILLVHQNRVPHGPQNSVPEGMFDDSINLVVWGHEHDCRISPEPVAGKQYVITQPGSSVATSLAEGEAIEKHVALVEIQGKAFKLTPIPLRTVRPFVLEEIILSDVAETEGLDITDGVAINKYLKRRVNELIQKAKQEWEEKNDEAIANGEDPLQPMLPLIRLRVDTTGVAMMSNPVRFGTEFQGRIANPRDVLSFQRAKRVGTRGGKVSVEEPELEIDNPEIPVAERLSRVRMGNLVKDYLSAQELQLLGESGLSDAIQMFVEKDDHHSISSYVSGSLKTLFKGVKSNDEMDDEGIDEALLKAKETHDKQYEEEIASSNAKRKQDNVDDAASAAGSVDSMEQDIDMGDVGFEEEEEEESIPPPKAKAKPKAKAAAKAPAKSKAKSKAASKAVSEDDDDIVEEEPEASEEETPAPKKKSRASVLSSAPTKKAPPKKKAPATTTKKQMTLSFSQATPGRSSRAAATKAQAKNAAIDVDDSDD